MPGEKIDEFLGTCEQILRKAARRNWNDEQMEKALSKYKLSEDQTKAISHTWKSESRKIHKDIVSKTVWNSELEDLLWRIDIKSNSREAPDINEPTAIIRLNLKKQESTSDVLHFEMDRKGLDKVITELDKIQEIIDKVGS
eukprot:CAMPEP_0167742756 /NCGR_PEP_ID=MMETSP0110_2-20121227/1620_1 /TAXON_ID=629695 /ORGANISM="Gymnochlora sp., Strain CCMP2014" /LENGTH=140 /DNA_ID=CAMNT_0007627017 /DNA_START=68 /DNA_END=490 /DNA_ORIENTATION=+